MPQAAVFDLMEVMLLPLKELVSLEEVFVIKILIHLLNVECLFFNDSFWSGK